MSGLGSGIGQLLQGMGNRSGKKFPANGERVCQSLACGFCKGGKGHQGDLMRAASQASFWRHWLA